MTSRAGTGISFVAALFAAILPFGCKQGSEEAGSPPGDTAGTTSQPEDATSTGTGNPLMTGVTPSEVKAGAAITVTGSGFGTAQGTSTLTVGGATATSVLSWSDTEITALVPADALTGAVKARVQGTDSEGKHLVVLWDDENPENVVVGGNHASSLHSQLMEDGQGGTIVVWNDLRSYDPDPAYPFSSTGQVNIHAQRLNSRGKILWHSGAVPLSTAAGGQWFPQLVSDGSGGAIVVWEDHRNGTADIYAQRISRNGDLVWATDVAVSTAPDDQQRPKIASDGAGGAIVVWETSRNLGTQFDVFAQRVDASGVPLWAPDGVAISTVPAERLIRPEIVSDGSGGAVIVWQIYGSAGSYMYAQRIDSAGAVKWEANGVRVSTTAASQQFAIGRPVPDGTGGAIVAFESFGAWTPMSSDLYAQRMDGSGALQWGDAGTIVSAAPGDQTVPKMTTDGAGGVIIAWEDCRVGSAARDIHAQRVSAAGATLWAADGVPVSAAEESQFEPRIVSDGKGGAIVTWFDYRDYDFENGVRQGVDTYAQRLDADGVAQWTTDGEGISTAWLHQMYPEITSDHSGGAIIVWEDSRSGSAVDLYAQGISFNGRQ